MRKPTNQQPITAKEIGRRLGLSQPTVSRILSGAAGHRVSDETRRRVLEAAEQMGYRPNAVARSLRQGRTNIIGFYTGYGVLNARHLFLAEIIGGLQRAAHPRQQDILLHGVFRGGSTDDIYGELIDNRIDGLVIHASAEDPLALRLRESSLPVVAVADAIPGIPSVVADDVAGMRLLLNLLAEKGHQRIGYVRPTQRFASVERRLAAFREWTEQHNRSVTDSPVYEINWEFTESLFPDLMTGANRPTAICCWNDLSAFDLVYHCRRHHVRVPEDLAITGFDGLFGDPRLHARELVTVRASWPEITDRAMELLMRQIDIRVSGETSYETGEPGDLAIPMLTEYPVAIVHGDTV